MKKKLLSVSALVLCAVAVAVCLLSKSGVTAETIAKVSPGNKVLGAFMIVALYGLKSLSIVFPVTVITFACGLMFSPFVALAVNICGMWFCLSLPYFIGRCSPGRINRILCGKFKAMKSFSGEICRRPGMLSCFLRAVCLFPGDVVSFYLGSLKVNYWRYILGSFCGVAPGLVAGSLFGSAVTDRNSAMFWISGGLCVLAALISGCMYLVGRQKGKDSDDESQTVEG